MFNGISHIVLRAQAFEACRTFYRDHLGLTEIAHGTGQDGQRLSLFQLGRSTLQVRADPAVEPTRDPQSGTILNSMYDNRCWISHFAFAMRDARSVYHLLAQRGVLWPFEPADQPAGHHLVRRRLLEVVDPAHALVQFAEPIDDEGCPLPARWVMPAPYREPWPGANRFDHVMLNAPDINVKREFYTETLGLTATPARPTRLGFQCDVTLGESVIELRWQPAIVAPLHAGALVEMGFYTDSLERVGAALIKRGIAVAGPAQIEILPGIQRRALSFWDPDGLPLQAVYTA